MPTLPIAEAAALAIRLLDSWSANAATDETRTRILWGGSACVLLGEDGHVRVVSGDNGELFVERAGPHAKEIDGPLAAWSADEAEPIALRFWVACILYTALCARRPFEQTFDASLARAMAEGRWSKPLHRVRPDAPERFAALVQTALVANSAMTPEDLRVALVRFAEPFDDSVAALFARSRRLMSPDSPQEPSQFDQLLRDDAGRLVLADSLEERGATDQAAWLRTEVAHHTATGARAAELLEELRALRTRLNPNFLAHAARCEVKHCAVRIGPQCSARWSDLETTGEPCRRACSTCDTTVRYVASSDDAFEANVNAEAIATDPFIRSDVLVLF